jgi:hypothetical protein
MKKFYEASKKLGRKILTGIVLVGALASPRSFSEEKNIYYFPDFHKSEFAEKQKEKIRALDTIVGLEGVLLEGIDNRLVSREDIETFQIKKQERFKKFELEMSLFDTELRNYLMNNRERFAAAVFLSYLPHTPSQKLLNSKIEDVRENRERYMKYAQAHLRSLQLTAGIARNFKIINDSEGKPLATPFSPGILYFGVQVPLRGIEDIHNYISRLEISNPANLKKMLEYEIFQDNRDLNGFYQNLIDFFHVSSRKEQKLRERDVLENISNLPGGNYALIFGFAHKEKLREISKEYEDINFIELEKSK